jgi:hypothetical protein
MGLAETKKQLLETINTCDDEKLLRVIHSILLSNTLELEQWQKDELDKRLKVNNESIPWDVVKERILARHLPSENG